MVTSAPASERTAARRAESDAARRIAEEDRNCWRVAHANRVAFLIDGANYFRALARAFMEAERTIFILGWDVHAGVRLLPDEPFGEWPTELGRLLNALARKRRRLHVYVLDWDFAVIYTLQRQMFPLLSFGWATHRRVHFRLDSRCPLAGSHHQKIVVVDDKVAFVGGMDIASARWDTPMHLVEDSRRIDPWGRPYPPHHDVQLAVDGEAAAALGDLARERWRLATGRNVPRRQGKRDPWPRELDPDARDVDVAFARTSPEEEGEEAREVETLYVDMIRAAQRTIYVENQYFTSAKVGDALWERLSSPSCPEIVVVLSYECHGWLEENVMGVLRARLLHRLRAADRHGKLHVYSPIAADGRALTVHSKVMVVDDVAARIGSSNLNNRSMGLDTECDALVEARGRDDVRTAIAHFRDRLLAEHCAAPAADMTRAISECGSIAAAIDKLGKPDGHHLRPLTDEDARWKESALPDLALLDPERPIEVWKLMESFLPGEMTAAARAPLTRALAAAGAIVALVATWSLTPGGETLEPSRAVAAFTELRHSPAGPMVAVAGIVLAGLLSAPITVMLALAGYLYGPLLGALIGFAGAMASAALNYRIGARLARDTVRRMAGATLNGISRRLADGGLMASFAVRFIPVAPFAIVNIVAGASRVDFREFFLGTLLAVAPGALAIAALGNEAAALFRHPSAVHAARFAGAAFALAALGLGARRLIHPERRRGARNRALAGRSAKARA